MKQSMPDPFDFSLFIQSGAIFSCSKDSVLIGYGPSAWKKSSDLDPAKPAFYFPDFFLHAAYPWLQFEIGREMSLEELRQSLQTYIPRSSSLKWHNPHEPLFHGAFQHLQSEFALSTLQKAVPYVFSYSIQQMDRDQLQYSLRSALSYLEKFPGYLYGFWTQDEGLLGVTPEILFEYRSDKTPQVLSTVAIAGSCPKGVDLTDFQNNPKEAMEHRLTIEGICQSLEPFGKVHVGHTVVLELPHINHLMTSIHVDAITKVEFEELVQAMHPTPALGAFPRREGAYWLRAYQEELNRRRFGAPAGLIDPHTGLARCVVGIRNVQWDVQGMRIGAGCGVVPGSEYTKEWMELQLKIDAVRGVLSL